MICYETKCEGCTYLDTYACECYFKWWDHSNIIIDECVLDDDNVSDNDKKKPE